MVKISKPEGYSVWFFLNGRKSKHRKIFNIIELWAEKKSMKVYKQSQCMHEMLANKSTSTYISSCKLVF